MKSGAGKARQRDGDGEPVPRTSASHPLTLSWVLDGTAPGLPGKLGLCYCPGKKARERPPVSPPRLRRVRRARAVNAAHTSAPHRTATQIKRKSVVWERQLDPDLQRLRRAHVHPAAASTRRRRRVRRGRKDALHERGAQ